jgi:HTH-type transcriptional regulator / antitoxin HipB
LTVDYPILSPGQLSAHLRAMRKARGLSQAQLGAVLGVGQTRITRIERDPIAVSVEQLLALLGALGVQLVLRPTGPGAAAGQPQAASQPKPTRAAAARRRPVDEPW